MLSRTLVANNSKIEKVYWKLEKKDKERAARAHRFMQPYYYQMIQAVLEEASKRDMVMDLTIGSAWPAGGTHITKEDSLRGIQKFVFIVINLL